VETAIERGTDTEYYYVCFEGLGIAIIEELIQNFTVFVVRVWIGQYIEELIQNVPLFVVTAWRGQYREELIQNVSVFFF
jgi:hypothetical protein